MRRRRFPNLLRLSTWPLMLLLAALLSGCAAAGALPWWYGWVWLVAAALLSGCLPQVSSETPDSVFAGPYVSEFKLSSLVSGNGSKGFIILDDFNYSSTGFAVSVGDLNGDGFADIAVGSPYVQTGPYYYDAGQFSIIYGGATASAPKININSIAPSQGRFFLGSTPYQLLGRSVAIVPSVDGDSLADLAVGLPMAGDYGAVVVFFGAETLPTSNPLTAGPGRTFLFAGSPDSRLGLSVAGGDINGDGIGDIAAGAPNIDAYGTDSGSLYEVAGTTDPWDDTYALDGGDRINRFQGGSAYGNFGQRIVGGGSVAGDNYDSLLIAGKMGGGQSKVWVRFGDSQYNAYTYFNATPFTFRLDNLEYGDELGASIALADINGDGRADILAGAPRAHGSVPTTGYDNYMGRVYVVFGHSELANTCMSPGILDGGNGFTIIGAAEYAFLGQGLAVGDINGDGVKDIIVSGYKGSGPQIFVLFGKSGPTPAFCHLSAFGPGEGILLHDFGYVGGEGAAPRSIAVGDVDGDGKDDIVLGWPEANGARGRVYVIFNKALQR